MNYIKYFCIILAIFFASSCNTDDNSEPSSIEIANYRLNFPTTFTLEELDGIDSNVGQIKGAGITLYFEYGWYSTGGINLPENEYTVTEDEIEGHYRQILKPVDSELNLTRLFMYRITDSIEAKGIDYNKLRISTNNIDASEQDMIIDVFSTLEIIE